MTKIVVGVDGSACAAQALRWARDLGRRRGWQLEAVLACTHPDHRGLVHRYGDELDRQRESPDSALHRYVIGALNAEERKDVSQRAVSGTPAQGLLEAGEAPDVALLVVGARGHGVVRRSLLGSVSLEVARRSTCPVAVVRGPELFDAGERRRIVVGVDGSASAQRALQWAIDDARGTDAELDVVHAWHPSYLGTESYSIVMMASVDAEKRAADLLSRSLAEADTGVLANPPSPILVQGGAIASLTEASQGADLVVVGSRGLGPVAGPILGSVSQHLAGSADCPIIIVPSRLPRRASNQPRPQPSCRPGRESSLKAGSCCPGSCPGGDVRPWSLPGETSTLLRMGASAPPRPAPPRPAPGAKILGDRRVS